MQGQQYQLQYFAPDMDPMIMMVVTKRQKDKNTKMQKDKKTKKIQNKKNRGPLGPPCRPQELEQGGHRPPKF